jgi:predicted Zn-dependent protease
VKEPTLSGNAFQELQNIQLVGKAAVPEYQGIITPACLVDGMRITS